MVVARPGSVICHLRSKWAKKRTLNFEQCAGPDGRDKRQKLRRESFGYTTSGSSCSSLGCPETWLVQFNVGILVCVWSMMGV